MPIITNANLTLYFWRSLLWPRYMFAGNLSTIKRRKQYKNSMHYKD